MSRAYELDLYSIVEATRAATSTDDLFEFFHVAASAFGFQSSGFIVARAGTFDPLPGKHAPISHTFFDELMDVYIDKSTAKVDPLLVEGQKTMLPFHWFSMLERKLEKPSENFIHSLRAIGYQDGVVIPVHVPGGIIVNFNFATTTGQAELSPIEYVMLQNLSNQVYTRYQELQNQEPFDLPTLTARESEILHWAAMGKSNNDIADILSISAHTVDTLLRRVYAKLNVSSRIGAVLKGVSYGLIRP